MINPQIVERGSERIQWEESCLSVPDLAQNVERSDKIVIRFQGADGAEHERTYEGFSAVVMQHELDHLQGVTLLEHSSLLKRTRYLQKQKKKAGAR
jgi:peptide deformylase